MINVVKGIFSSIFGWKFYLAAAILVFGLLFSWHYKAIQDVREQAIVEVMLDLETERNAILTEKIKVDQETKEQIERITDANNKDKQVIAKLYSDLLSDVQRTRLQPSSIKNGNGLSSSTRIIWENPTGRTEKVISGEIAEFLVLEAKRADEFRVELDRCYQQYDLAKDKVNTFGKTKE